MISFKRTELEKIEITQIIKNGMVNKTRWTSHRKFLQLAYVDARLLSCLTVCDSLVKKRASKLHAKFVLYLTVIGLSF